MFEEADPMAFLSIVPNPRVVCECLRVVLGTPKTGSDDLCLCRQAARMLICHLFVLLPRHDMR